MGRTRCVLTSVSLRRELAREPWRHRRALARLAMHAKRGPGVELLLCRIFKTGAVRQEGRSELLLRQIIKTGRARLARVLLPRHALSLPTERPTRCRS